MSLRRGSSTRRLIASALVATVSSVAFAAMEPSAAAEEPSSTSPDAVGAQEAVTTTKTRTRTTETKSKTRTVPPFLALGVRAGATAATASGSVTGAPMLEMDARVRWETLRLEWFGGVSGWSLPSGAGHSAAMELFAATGARLLVPVSASWRAVLGGGPAVAVTSGPGRPTEASPALYLAPGFEMGTRRRSLTLELGLRSWILMDAVRLGAVAGVSYRF